MFAVTGTVIGAPWSRLRCCDRRISACQREVCGRGTRGAAFRRDRVSRPVQAGGRAEANARCTSITVSRPTGPSRVSFGYSFLGLSTSTPHDVKEPPRTASPTRRSRGPRGQGLPLQSRHSRCRSVSAHHPPVSYSHGCARGDRIQQRLARRFDATLCWCQIRPTRTTDMPSQSSSMVFTSGIWSVRTPRSITAPSPSCLVVNSASHHARVRQQRDRATLRQCFALNCVTSPRSGRTLMPMSVRPSAR